MKTIIAPTDFSPNAINATDYAFDLAQSIGASLMLVHIFNVPVSISEVPVVLTSEEEVRTNAMQQMARLKTEYESKPGEKVKIYGDVRLGIVEDELESLCKKIRPFAVVMASKGASALERVMFGSNTLTAIKHLPAPVMVIPPQTRFHAVKRIGFACDLKKVVETTPVKEIEALVQGFDADFHVLNIDHENRGFTPETSEEILKLNMLFTHVSPEYHYLDNPDVETGINAFVDSNQIDLLIVIPKKHHLWDSIFHKSYSKELALHTHVPMMAIHEE